MTAVYYSKNISKGRKLRWTVMFPMEAHPKILISTKNHLQKGRHFQSYPQPSQGLGFSRRGTNLWRWVSLSSGIKCPWKSRGICRHRKQHSLGRRIRWNMVTHYFKMYFIESNVKLRARIKNTIQKNLGRSLQSLQYLLQFWEIIKKKILHLSGPLSY